MKHLARISVAIAISCTAATATPLCSTMASLNNFIAGAPDTITAPPVSSDTYVPCTVSNLTFSNVSYDLVSGSFTVSPDAVNVIQTTPPSPGEAVSIEFDPNLTASSDLELEFQVTGALLDVDLGWNGSGTGFVNEVVCTVFTATGVCPSADWLATLNVNASGVTATPESGCTGCTSSTADGTASVRLGTLEPEVWIFKDINSGSAPYSEVLQSFATPEPMTFSLIGIALLGLGLRGRRLRGR
jgi:hypothetical protein